VKLQIGLVKPLQHIFQSLSMFLRRLGKYNHTIYEEPALPTY